MAKISICIEMLCGEVDFYERPAKAKALGFSAVEFWGTGNKDIDRLKKACGDAGVAVAGFCGPGGVSFVEKQPVRKLKQAMKESIAIAKKLGNKALIVTVGNTQEGVPAKRQMNNIIKNLKVIAPLAEGAGLKLAVEPLNTLVDHKGYFLDRTADGVEIARQVASPAVGLLYDVYHMQIMEGNLIATIKANAGLIYHVHIGDVPGRMEPGTGEINYANVLKAIDAAGYQGYCGFEFRPSDSSEGALTRAKKACGLV